MNKLISICFLFTCMFTACTSNVKKTNLATHKLVNQINKTQNKRGDDTTKVLLSKIFLHAFSDPIKQDTFKLILTGKTLTQGNLTFEIISFNNEKIYSEHYHGYDLLGDLDDMSVKQDEDTIKVRFKNFFNADAFYMPALDRQIDPTDTDYVDIKTQRDIASDTTSIGFIYNIGYESTIEIAYSKSNRKTVVCFASD